MSEVAAKIFEESLNKVCLVQLKGGRSVRGKLYSFDQNMKLVLEESADVTNTEVVKKLETIIVRGKKVELISQPLKCYGAKKRSVVLRTSLGSDVHPA